MLRKGTDTIILLNFPLKLNYLEEAACSKFGKKIKRAL